MQITVPIATGCILLQSVSLTISVPNDNVFAYNFYFSDAAKILHFREISSIQKFTITLVVCEIGNSLNFDVTFAGYNYDTNFGVVVLNSPTATFVLSVSGGLLPKNFSLSGTSLWYSQVALGRTSPSVCSCDFNPPPALFTLHPLLLQFRWTRVKSLPPLRSALKVPDLHLLKLLLAPFLPIQTLQTLQDPLQLAARVLFLAVTLNLLLHQR